MRTYLLLFSISFIAALIITPFVRRLGRQLSPASAKAQQWRRNAIAPKWGGLVLWGATFITLCLTPLFGTKTSLNFWDNISWYAAILIPATLVLLIGIYEDWRGPRLWLRLTGQILAALILYKSGYAINLLSLPLDKELSFPSFLGLPLLIVWVMVISNAFTLVEEPEGVARGGAAFALIVLLFLSLFTTISPQVSLLSIILVGAIIGFFYYSFPPSSIRLGHSGISFLGVLLACLSLQSSQKSNTFIVITIPLIAFGLPILELVISLTRYVANRFSSKGHYPEHLHQMLLRQGVTVRQVFILFYAIVASVTLLWSLMLTPRRVVSGFVFAFIGLVGILVVQRLRLSQLTEFGYKLKDTVTGNRRGLTLNAELRRICFDLRQAYSAEKVFSTLSRLLQLGEFDYVQLEINPRSYAYSHTLRSAAEKHGWIASLKEVDLEGARLVLSQASHPLHPNDLSLANGFWRLTVPLGSPPQVIGSLFLVSSALDAEANIDLKNICGLLRVTLSEKLVEIGLSEPAEAFQ